VGLVAEGKMAVISEKSKSMPESLKTTILPEK